MKTSTRTLAGAGGFSALAIAGAAALLVQLEGRSNDPYWDALGKVWTVCDGETNVPMRRYSDAECDAMKRRTLEKFGNQKMAHCLPAGLPPSAQIAFLSIGYNIGPEAFCRSSMSRKALAGDFRGACRSIELYQFVGGKDCRIRANRCGGIPKRRAKERSVCESGLS